MMDLIKFLCKRVATLGHLGWPLPMTNNWNLSPKVDLFAELAVNIHRGPRCKVRRFVA